MIILVKHPDNWLQKAQSQQFLALQHFDVHERETLKLKRDEIASLPSENWGLLRVVNGLVGLKIETNRILALEAGDCWLGHPGDLLSWYQEGAVEIEVWPWQAIVSSLIPSIIHRFGDLMLSLINHNTQVPPDPMPGFEFFKSGEVIIQEGEEANSVYTLIQGKAKVTINGQVVGEAKENEILGLQAMLLRTTRTASVVADGPCSVVKVTYDKFHSLIETRPELVISTMETMAQHIDRANKRMTESGS